MNTGVTTPPVKKTGPSESPAERKAMALRRIDASRTKLIVCLLPDEPRRNKAPAQPGSAPQPPDLQGFARGLVKRIERNGLADSAWRTARAWGRRWWKRQPWHAPAELVFGTLAHEARPIIRRHPWALLAAGAALGATLVAARPFVTHSIRRGALPLRRHMGGLLWSQLAQAPVQIALAGALAAWITDLSKQKHQTAEPASKPQESTETNQPPDSPDP